MGIFSRMADIVSANVNDLLDHAEQPEKMLKQIIREIEDTIDKAKRDLAAILADAHRMEKSVNAKAGEVDTWEKRAGTAVDDGDDNLARQALERKRAHAQELAGLQTQLSDTQEAADGLKRNIEIMADKLTDARARFSALSARAVSAKNVKQAHEKIRKFQDASGALGKLEKMERHIEDMESEAKVLADRNYGSDAVEQHFAKHEQNRELDAELAALKAARRK